MEKKDKFMMILVAGLIVAVLLLSWKIGLLRDGNQDNIVELRKSIIASDSLQKEKDGQYAKLVDYYKSEKDLKNELKESNKELYQTIKKNNERILSLTSAVITLQGQVSEGFGHIDPVDTNKINLALKYPNDKEPFINWIGSVDKVSTFYKGDWSFGKLPLQIVLTEEKRGLWKSRLIGPEWLVVDSMSINSLPAEDYTENKERNIQFLVGGSYNSNIVPMTMNSLSVGGGVNLYGSHNIILNLATNKTVGINYYYKFKKFKKRK
jgi:hypothetical protein